MVVAEEEGLCLFSAEMLTTACCVTSASVALGPVEDTCRVARLLAGLLSATEWDPSELKRNLAFSANKGLEATDTADGAISTGEQGAKLYYGKKRGRRNETSVLSHRTSATSVTSVRDARLN